MKIDDKVRPKLLRTTTYQPSNPALLLFIAWEITGEVCEFSSMTDFLSRIAQTCPQGLDFPVTARAIGTQ